MLDSTLEFFTLAASNSLAVFCFCNLIIGIILVSGSSKPNESSPFLSDENLKKDAASSSADSIKVNKEDRLSSVGMADESRPFLIIRNVEIFEENAVSSFEKANESMKSNHDDEKLWSVSIPMDDIIIEEESDADKEEDDELRERIEEFIAKINRGWRDEKLETFS
ncbi:uncharacterized protein LOC142533103 [Primulina tabacum]|uniref:uncharacterized protein LOC142533103 n=1 Tax=Primulina tabacum TaxID=48773 RepID=UPI003F5A43B4